MINWWWSYYKTDKNPVLQGMSSQFLFHFQRFQNMNSTFGWFLESIACVILLLIFCLCSKCLLQIYTPKWMVHIKSTKMAADFAEFIFGPGDICLFGVPTTLVDWKSKVSMIPYSLCLSCLSLIGQNWRRGGAKIRCCCICRVTFTWPDQIFEGATSSWNNSPTHITKSKYDFLSCFFS